MQRMRNIGAIASVAGLFALPIAAQAQGIPGGAGRGANEGGKAVGVAAGGVLGGGGVGGYSWCRPVYANTWCCRRRFLHCMVGDCRSGPCPPNLQP
jgi:hypothetical protein